MPVISATSPMAHARTFHQLIPMPNGEVMAVGGTGGRKFTDAGGILEPEIWNPQTGQWRGMANMSVVRGYHSTALLLPDATVLTAGGGYTGGDHLDGQVFTPPYLYASDGTLAVRPTLSAAVSSVDVGNSFEVTTTGDIQDFGFVRMSATTHAVNTDSRFYKPQFEQTGADTWSVTIHQNPNVATPGFWMLFALDANGVPSVAEIIQVTAVDTRLSNLAIGATATQSSTYQNASAARAIDGNLNGSVANASVAITDLDAQAWWELDLGRVVEIDSIRLWNRTDCCAERLSDVHVLVSEAPFSSPVLADTQNQDGVSDYPISGAASQQTDVAVGRFGRYVRVQLEGTNHLQLAEVQVFGQRLTGISNLALQGSASQSSQFGNDSRFPASNVINGNTGGNGAAANQVNHTNADANAWWELDLGDVYDLDSIKIWNRNDCCQDRLANFVLLVSDDPFDSKDLNTSVAQAGVYSEEFTGTPARTTESILGRAGRYVRVQLLGTNFLHLAEVQVFGAPPSLPIELNAIESVPRPQQEPITFTADATGTGTLQYRWNFGDGTPDVFSTNPTTNHQYAAPGRYVVSVVVTGANGDEQRQTFTQIVHGNLTADKPVSSSAMAEIPARQQLWNVNPDNNTVTVIDSDSYAVIGEIDVGEDPSSLGVAADGRVWVVNRRSASISVVNAQTLTVEDTLALPPASQPYGIVFDNTHAYVALEATGELVKLATDGTVTNASAVGPNPRHLTLDANAQRLYVSRFITPPLPGEDTANPVVEDDTGSYGGELLVVNPADLSITQTIVLAHSNREASEHQGPGIPNYLGAAVISPVGGTAWLPSKQDNILAGALRGGAGITFDQTVRAITSVIDLNTHTENLQRRLDHDNASIAGAAAFDPYGTTLFVSLEGNRQISLIDSSQAIEIGRIDTGRAPQSLLVSADGTRLYAHNFMDRTISVFDIADIVNAGAITATELATIDTVANELLQPQVLRGKQLFYDARDDRLAHLDYMSCASCHADGEHDGRVWDFTSLGEGLRNTITLRGRAGMGHGMLHWSGNFDEPQDFEGQIREFAGGTGLMNDDDFARTADPLGNRKAGLSSDLDALTAYMSSLDTVDASPWRLAGGS
ncbi:MAG: discoidin domain-containing protein, partial [Pseudomonadota bacterium]